ncbi:modulator of FtsH protease [Inhella inkyongensis]|uniref:Modulator of FtsH protease n=1 Tax=Inhella inkyongensis TaxID=392593 RepID=A0A840RZF1_9BURK|nr:Bax inhibitor-1/YccA family protein [Inhella inkyongensis]MBB5204167.1 modulator of FtsH protease [Inhella inkyongensis]
MNHLSNDTRAWGQVARSASVGPATLAPPVHRVLRNTYALLSLTLLFSAGVAAAGVLLGWSHPGLVLSLVGTLGLFFLVHKLRNRAAAIPAVFALTGFLGYSLGPVLGQHLALPGGAQTVALALAATGLIVLSLSAYALVSRRDFSALGGFLMAGMVLALLAGLAAVFFEIPALSLAVAGAVALLSAGLILFETSRIVQGGETNYVMATVGLYLSIYNLFSSLLALLGFANQNE